MPGVDAVIAGAGIAGIATAWQLAERLGETNAVIVDPRPPLSLTSGRPEANYRNWWPQPAMVALTNRSIELMEGLLAAGAGFTMNRRGYLYVTADERTAAGLPGVVERYRAAGLGPDAAELLLDRAGLLARYPHLSPDVRGAVLARQAGSLDAVGLGLAMLERAEARGVRLVRGEVVGLESAAAGVTAVRVAGDGIATAEGGAASDAGLVIETSRFVNAAGPFAARVAGLPGAGLAGAGLPLETVLRQKVLLHDPLGVVPRTAPFTIGLDALDGMAAGVHIKPDESVARDGIKLGWAEDQRPLEPVSSPRCPPEFPARVLARAATLIPGLAAYLDGGQLAQSLIAHDGGFYARTADGLPLIGPTGPAGAISVAGLAGFGAMVAAGAGELAAQWLLADPPLPLQAAFDPRRFGLAATTRVGSADRLSGEL